MQHAEQRFAPRLLLGGLPAQRRVKGVGEHGNVVHIDHDLAVLRHTFHFAPRRAALLQRGNPRQVFRPGAAQRSLQAVNYPEVMPNRQAVIDHLLRRIRRGIVLINKLTAQLAEHHRFTHRIRASSTMLFRFATISLRRGSFSASSQRATWWSPWLSRRR